MQLYKSDCIPLSFSHYLLNELCMPDMSLGHMAYAVKQESIKMMASSIGPMKTSS